VALFADLLRRPSFDQAALGRAIRKRQALIAQEGTDPGAVAQRTMAPLLYGANSAYGRASAAGVTGEIAALTSARLKALSDAWLRPDKARLFVVSDLPQQRIAALLEQGFGDWRAIGEPGRTRDLTSAPATPRIVVVDRPGSPQSLVLGAIPTPLRLGDEPDRLFAALAGAGAIGGRIGTDLRERNGWTYGVGSGYSQRKGAIAFSVRTSVQADRTGFAMVHVRDLLTDYVTTHPITSGEWRGVIDGALSGGRGRFERGDAVLDTMQSNDFAGRPDDYPATIGERYRKLSAADVAGATHDALDPERMIWVVVGDAATITPQLRALRLPFAVKPDKG
jgi:predicted Zn-dependent peptidase